MNPLDALLEYERSGGAIVFWACPNCPEGIVEWKHGRDGNSVATCKTCGKSNMSVHIPNEFKEQPKKP